jgi:uncharacterized membrane protein YfcA
MYEGITPWICGIAAAFIAGLAKTGIPGTGILTVPLLVMVFPAKLAVGATLPMLIAADLFAVAFYRQHAQWDRLWRLFPYVTLGIIGGAFALNHLESKELQPLLAILIIVLVALEWVRSFFGLWKNVPHTKGFTLVMGTLAGFATTFGNVAGPIMNIYLISIGLDKDKFMGTSAWYFCIFNLVKFPIFLGLGMITTSTLSFNLTMIPFIAIGAFSGKWILPYISQELFKKIALFLAIAGAIKLLF